MSFNILIASHFHLDLRYKLFLETVKSLVNQTLIPTKVLISYSKEENINTDIEKIFHENFKTKNIDYYINYSVKKLSQFEHLFKIYKSGEINSDWICFCDDDDMYDNKRLYFFNETIKKNPMYHTFADYFKLIYLDSIYSEIKILGKGPQGQDFANYVVSKNFFIDFFEKDIIMFNINIKDSLTDCYFKALASRRCININKGLYYYRKCPYIEKYNCWTQDSKK